MSSPIDLQSDEPEKNNKVAKITIGQNQLEQTKSGEFKAVSAQQQSQLETGLVLRAIGYRGKPMPSLPFDEKKGVITNNGGRVTQGNETIPNVYVTGWIKRGPRGVIGSNKKCANETVEHFFTDVRGSANPTAHIDAHTILATLSERVQNLVLDQDWHNIDYIERMQGRKQQRPRAKLTHWPQFWSAMDVSEKSL